MLLPRDNMNRSIRQSGIHSETCGLCSVDNCNTLCKSESIHALYNGSFTSVIGTIALNNIIEQRLHS